MAKFIINEKWYLDKKDDIQAEAECIVIAAAKIIRAQIREQKHDSKFYPTDEDIGNIDQSNRNRWVPQHLQTFLKTIIPSKLKQNSIGHVIVQSARPRSVITPILFGLGIEMDHVFGSKWLINELAQLGFSISYDEVMSIGVFRPGQAQALPVYLILFQSKFIKTVKKSYKNSKKSYKNSNNSFKTIMGSL